jgi:hypothetical protein
MKKNNSITRFLRYLFIILVLIFGLITQSLSVSAHPPSNMVLEYDFESQQLDVTITHNTPAPNQHYVEKVEIWVNDDLKLTRDYTSQPTANTFTYTYDVSAKDSDIIKVKATCSISGDITEEITVVDPAIKELDVSVTPNISELSENEVQFFNVEATHNDEPVQNITVEVTAEYGTITGLIQVPGEPFQFKYTAPSVDEDTKEILNITVSKQGYETDYSEVKFNIKDLDGSTKKEMSLQLSPSITSIEENTDQSFTLEVTSDSAPVSDLTFDIDLDFGFISEIDETAIGRYEFIYFGVEVSEDETETMKITAKKDGYKDGSLEVQFTIKNKQPSSKASQTLDGIITGDEYEFKVKLDGDNFILHWNSDGDIIQFAMEARTTGWVSIGFEPTVKMKDADMIFGWVEDNGDAFVLDTYSTGEFGPHPPDGSDDILEYGGTEANGKTIIEFQRFFDTDDPEDKEIKKSGEVKIIWAIGGNDDYTSGHTSRGYGTIDISTGEYTAGTELWLIHATFMVLGLIFLISGSCIAKLLRKKKWWLKTHRALGVLGAVFGILGITIAIIMVETAGTGHIRYPHSLIGIITIIFLFITPTLGYKISKGKTSKGLKATHRWIGRIALILMIFNIVSGLVLKGII